MRCSSTTLFCTVGVGSMRDNVPYQRRVWLPSVVK